MIVILSWYKYTSTAIFYWCHIITVEYFFINTLFRTSFHFFPLDCIDVQHSSRFYFMYLVSVLVMTLLFYYVVNIYWWLWTAPSRVKHLLSFLSVTADWDQFYFALGKIDDSERLRPEELNQQNIEALVAESNLVYFTTIHCTFLVHWNHHDIGENWNWLFYNLQYNTRHYQSILWISILVFYL